MYTHSLRLNMYMVTKICVGQTDGQTHMKIININIDRYLVFHLYLTLGIHKLITNNNDWSNMSLNIYIRTG